jgi:hypothetical protein
MTYVLRASPLIGEGYRYQLSYFHIVTAANSTSLVVDHSETCIIQAADLYNWLMLRGSTHVGPKIYVGAPFTILGVKSSELIDLGVVKATLPTRDDPKLDKPPIVLHENSRHSLPRSSLAHQSSLCGRAIGPQMLPFFVAFVFLGDGP